MISMALLLAQAYKDCWDEYCRSLKNETCLWDYIVITASNESQAEAYKLQLEARENYLPAETKILIIPDKNGTRIGSGGSTLQVIRTIRELEKSFNKLRILVIHSGGDSKRVPQYSALGKLFSPVPYKLPDGRSSTLFDELIITMSAVPARISSGMVLMSGDVQLLFNPLQIEYDGKKASAISFKEDVNTGKDHGVYFADPKGYVQKFLHKQSVESLQKLNAVDERNRVDIDTGVVIFPPKMLDALYDLGEKYINDRVRLSLYGDFLYPLADDSTLETFLKENPEGEFCPELTEARKSVWNALRGYRMSLQRLAPAKFTHFGTTGEILRLMNSGIEDYKELGWAKIVNSSVPDNSCAAYNSVLSGNATIESGCYLENSYVHGCARIGKNCVISHIDIDDFEIPDNLVVHGLKLRNRKFVCRIFGVKENPKEFWNEPRFPACESLKEALKRSLDIVTGVSNPDAECLSLSESFSLADTEALMAWIEHMKDLVEIEHFYAAMEAGVPESDLEKPKMNKTQTEWLEKKLIQAPFKDKLRLYYFFGYPEACFNEISRAIVPQISNRNASVMQDDVKVSLPLRVNFGGGWTDTPPYCIENGGTVLNAAILLDGQRPVEVCIRRRNDERIIIQSFDMEVYGEFTSISELIDTGDLHDPFALQKACLKACGICDTDIGFYIESDVKNVPKGSGLGTSSILAAACVKAISLFFGLGFSDDELISRVLEVEQLMSTGGGWQDQVGGLLPGIKLLTSEPGLQQKIKSKKITLSEKTLIELNERFALIYTGQRRVAKYLLRNVVGRYIGNEPGSVYAHAKIKEMAVEMADALKQGNVDDFARLLNEHWAFSKMIDEGSSNALIDQIFMSIDDLIDARMVCGAGGGGFLQIMKKKGVSNQQIHERLKEYFESTPVDVWEAMISQ